MGEMDEIIKEFLIESYENLDQLDQDLVSLEENPKNIDTLSSVFRVIHTIKGTAGFLGFTQLGAITHVGETLLSRLRDGELSLTPELNSPLLKMVDAVRSILGSIEKTGQEGTRDDSSLIQTLKKLIAMESNADEESIEHEEAKTQANEPLKASTTSVSDSTIRVDIQILDKLMTCIGELVLTRNQIVQFSNLQENFPIAASCHKLNNLTTELQGNIMKTRMQPIGNVWNKFPRVVRDLARKCQKKIRVEMEGKDTELDRGVIEAIKDPMTHIIRNSVDHGIEPPDERKKAGKPEEGMIRLQAFHEAGKVNLLIEDDGRGINPERVKAKALEKGLITQEQSENLSESELVNLIFLPGFSTAQTVTDISGRGVGMDVVRTNIEKLGGTLDINNRFGKGMILVVRIPLTLAIVPGLIISSARRNFAIPQINLVELLRIDEKSTNKIEMVQNTPVYRLRGKLLPIVYLNELLGQSENKTTAKNIVVLQADEHQFGLVVDEIKDVEEIVVKPLGKQLQNIPVYSGATILGDGKLALILDVMGLAQRSNVISLLQEKNSHKGDSGEKNDGNNANISLIIFKGPDNGRMAIPLTLVNRLEEVKKEQIEMMGHYKVIQYRGAIMPLVFLNNLFGIEPHSMHNDTSKENFQVVVYTSKTRSVGIVVDEITDIIQDSFEITSTDDKRPGIMGSAIIQGHVTELLDIAGVIRSAQLDFNEIEKIDVSRLINRQEEDANCLLQ